MRESKFGKWVKCVENVSLWGSHRREGGKRPVSVSFFPLAYITGWAGPETPRPPRLHHNHKFPTFCSPTEEEAPANSPSSPMKKKEGRRGGKKENIGFLPPSIPPPPPPTPP